ncbi:MULTISPECIES: hypothetical protein [Enterococcus]|uniref:Uncharacterized protein n=2 Tax=Enterococcus thailandicus TaxID=417368 RepID=A0A510WFB6_ENTTH|nr:MULTISPECIES: hypothetical protein [Enterococcus]MDA3963997.1 hypothetical protein [Enterococcus thailandicus]MDT2750442.1 hypothetical protein [Enterococcus thailandicus]MDT2775003.1 hypothetical protein [Enterococcus thailandicus]MDT2793499.1 hypothetical protein [Enterococcus thailandicus]MDT2846113.1 hypothetical protein [Enterococcus thailandicus]
MKKYDGEFSGLGMIAGLLIGLAKGNILFGLMLGVVCGVAMDWGANLWNDYQQNRNDDS